MSDDDDTIALLLLGGALLMAAPEPANGNVNPPQPMPPQPPLELGQVAWGWPAPVIVVAGREYRPVVSDAYGWSKGRRDKQGRKGRMHWGADLTYPTRGLPPPLLATMKRPPLGQDLAAGGGFWCPAGLPALACAEGQVWQAELGDRGWWIRIVHNRGRVASYYQHLTGFARGWKRGDPVARWATLGTIGDDPANTGDIRHLHFQLEAWDPVARSFARIDPLPYLRRWPYAPNRPTWP